MTLVKEVLATVPENPAASIYRQFRGLIVSGQLSAGERLPTVRQTARDMAVSPGTAARAYKLLEQDGLVITRTAAGTRVAPDAALLSRDVLGAVRRLVDEGLTAGADLSDVLDVVRATWSSKRGELADVEVGSGRSR